MARNHELFSVRAVGEAVHVRKGDGPRVRRRRFVVRGRERSKQERDAQYGWEISFHGVTGHFTEVMM
jgi:hypothetical protein